MNCKCGNEIVKKKNKYCSRKCAYKYTKPMLGKKHSDETIKKMKAAQSKEKHHYFGKKLSNDTRAKMSAAHIGHIVTKETRNRISLKHKGVKKSEVTKAKLSLALTGCKYSEERNRKISFAHAKRSALGLENPSGYGIRSWYMSKKSGEWNWCQSALENKRMMQLDLYEDVIDWTKNHGIVIQYTVDGKIRNYSPDFLIRTKSGIFIEELKGYVNPKLRDQFELKNAAAKDYCNDANYKFVVVFPNNIKYCSQSYAIDVDVLT